MKKHFLLAVALAFTLLSPSIAYALNLNGARYVGQAKLAGQPIDFWTVMTCDDEDADINIAGAFSLSGEYTFTQGTNATLKINLYGKPYILKSTDGGSSFTGSITYQGKKFDLWILKVPSEMTPASETTDQLEKIVSSSDGYTVFLSLTQNGAKMCVPADAAFNAGSKSLSVTFDNATFQKMFGNLQKCSYSIQGNKITLTEAASRFNQTGTIYDSGNYIEIPLGSAQGMQLSLIFIR